MQKVMTVAGAKCHFNIVLYFKRQTFVNFAAKSALRSRKISSILNNNFRNLYTSKNLFNHISPGGSVRLCDAFHGTGA